MSSDPSAAKRRPRWRRPRWLLTRVPLALLAVFLLIQAVPYGRAHTNPPVTAEPAWDAPTKALFVGACGDCHSNLTTWPWYSSVAPVSWLTQSDVDTGRQVMNLSETSSFEADEVAEVIDGGGMPPWYYSIAHPKARLSADEKAALIAGMQRAAGGGQG